MQRAFDWAIFASMQSSLNYKIGAALFDKKGGLLTWGFNKAKTHPMQYKYAKKVGTPLRCYLHAELDALTKLDQRDKPYTIYVVRRTKEGFGMARPCPVCYAALVANGVRKIVYTTNHNNIEIEEIG